MRVRKYLLLSLFMYQVPIFNLDTDKSTPAMQLMINQNSTNKYYYTVQKARANMYP